jgi:hypothetical protein
MPMQKDKRNPTQSVAFLKFHLFLMHLTFFLFFFVPFSRHAQLPVSRHIFVSSTAATILVA